MGGHRHQTEHQFAHPVPDDLHAQTQQDERGQAQEDGGAGFAERGYAVLRDWLQATRATVASCECESGCPSCVQSPKCGNGNDPLDKAGAVRLLDLVLAGAPAERVPAHGA